MFISIFIFKRESFMNYNQHHSNSGQYSKTFALIVPNSKRPSPRPLPSKDCPFPERMQVPKRTLTTLFISQTNDK